MERYGESDLFHSEPDGRQPYTIFMPPPNVTGVLHVGHVLNNTIQDVLARRARQKGYNVCWIPGTDHASIATEAKVVRWLAEQGMDKRKIGREKFLEYAWEWKERHEKTIITQLKRLGVSCDWRRYKFTMDEDMNRAVTKTFVSLYNAGLIYRDYRIIHWDPEARTSLSDEEVKYREVEGRLYYVRYPLAEGGYVVVATTRPETIVADTALAVHPEDERYKHLIGSSAIVPVVNRRVPIVADERVDPTFGTGVLKVTPAHDATDFEIGRKHHLPVINAMNEDGTMNENAGPLAGLGRFEARKKMVELLENEGLLEKAETITHSVGFSERTDAIVEPRLSLQWFVKMKPLAELALKAVREGHVRFHPAHFVNVYTHWLENVKDWCISRQLWWGHRIPAWYCSAPECNDKPIVAEEAPERCPRCGNTRLQQDPDVLDTWFSSWLWPLSTLGFFEDPENRDFRYYYPSEVLVTAPEILFFWVARMIMAGMWFAKKEPFRHVYLHGIIRDRQRRKMSKSLGNSPDVLGLIDRYGADGVRVGVLMSAPAGNDLLFDESLCVQGRNFCNKLWNAARLLLSLEPDSSLEATPAQKAAIKWLEAVNASRLHQSVVLLESFQVSEALKNLYSHVWDEFCSLFLEAIKPKEGKKIAQQVHSKAIQFFKHILHALHPYAPLITEELWQYVRNSDESPLLALSRWEPPPADISLPLDTETLQKIVAWARQNKHHTIYVVHNALFPQLEPLLPMIEQLAGTTLHVTDKVPENTTPWIVDGLIFAVEGSSAEKERVHKELKRLRDLIQKTKARLSNPSFLEKAPAHIVERERKKLEDLKLKLREIEEQLGISEAAPHR